jgi:N-acetyl-beta-hexosaminidase
MQYSVSDAYTVKGGSPSGVLDPIEDKTYELLTGIFKDMANMFPEKVIMLGGDEVRLDCFSENPKYRD